VDWSDPDSVIKSLIAYVRVLAGGRRPFDEVAARDLVRRDVARARDFAAVQNHDVRPEGEAPSKPLSALAAPTLVIHGTADPMFPIEHGGPSPRRSRRRGSRLWTEPVTGSIEPIGRRSCAPPSSTPRQAKED
jgi:pimeloyl-ACP methyl ester carboxylesterase